jgi:hypothetical protein
MANSAVQKYAVISIQAAWRGKMVRPWRTRFRASLIAQARVVAFEIKRSAYLLFVHNRLWFLRWREKRTSAANNIQVCVVGSLLLQLRDSTACVESPQEESASCSSDEAPTRHENHSKMLQTIPRDPPHDKPRDGALPGATSSALTHAAQDRATNLQRCETSDHVWSDTSCSNNHPTDLCT